MDTTNKTNINPSTNTPYVDYTGQPQTMPNQPAQSITSDASTQTTPITPPTTTSTDALRSSLNKSGTDANTVPTGSFDQFAAGILPTTQPSEAPNAVDQYQQLRKSQGVQSLQDVITSQETQKATLLDQLQQFKNSDTGNAQVTADFAAGRLSVAQQNIQDKIDAINRLEAVNQTNLNTKTDYIKSIMDFTSQDYAATNDAYEKQFSRNLSLQSAFSTEQNTMVDNARATLTTMQNMMNSSGMSLKELTPAQQYGISQLELQAGMQPGTITSLMAAKPKANIVGTSTYKGQTTIVSRDPETGAMSTTVFGEIQETPSDKPLTPSDITKYQTDHPNAGITMGDTLASATQKIQNAGSATPASGPGIGSEINSTVGNIWSALISSPQ